MRKRVLAAVLLLAMLLSVTACGNGTTSGGESKSPAGTASQPAQGPGESAAQPTENAGTEAPQPMEEPPAAVNFIFSARPVAAYEVTGFDLHSIYDEPYTDSEGHTYELPIVKLTPGENSFIIFCMQADFETLGDGFTATVRSPAGSSRWEAQIYSCFDVIIDPVPEGYALLQRGYYSYDEEAYGGGYDSLMDPALHYISFSELYHPDAAQNDSICVVDVAPFPGLPGIDTIEGAAAAVADTFVELGGTAIQIPVDEALAMCHVEVE